ncbi:MAG: serine protease [Clostridium perfringens]|nr:serine protease [Clostridium perfringens]
MDIFTQLVLVIGRMDSDGFINMLGTGFIVSNDGKIVTSRHVVADNDENLVILAPNIRSINEYQDTTDVRCNYIKASILDSDPFRDITIIKAELKFTGIIPSLGDFDDMYVGEQVSILGFPHCVEGRRVLTFQQAGIGAKVLLEAQGIKSKHAVINTQTRPGQSGSLIFSINTNKIVGMLVGTFAPNSGVIIAGINPRELNQTTHCISAEYIKNML